MMNIVQEPGLKLCDLVIHVLYSACAYQYLTTGSFGINFVYFILAHKIGVFTVLYI